MINHRRALVGVLATLLLVAACGGSASQAPTGAPGATATPAGASEEPSDTQQPTDTAEPTDGPDVSLAPGAAGDLERMLPSEVNGITFEKGSFDGSTFPGGLPIGEGDDDFAKFLSDNGKTLNDVKLAVATATETTAAGSLVMAIQIKGVPADKLLEYALKDMTSSEQVSIGGKQAYGGSAAGFGAWVYVKGDVIFYVLGMGGEDLAEGIFQQLP